MNILRYKPTANSLLDWDFEHILDNFFGNDCWSVSGNSYPSVDVKQEDGRYVLEADIPGLTEKDIDVKVEDNLLTISSKQQEKKTDHKNYLIHERRGYTFSRSFVLPGDVDRGKIDASFSNGVLQLSLAKTPETKPRQIEIKSK